MTEATYSAGVAVRRRVWLCQINGAYGSSLFLPYSCGLLQAYAEADEEIHNNYAFSGFIVEREPIEQVVERLSKEPPDVFGASLYIWNAEWTKALCRAVKRRWPDCLIVVGGPHVPDHCAAFLEENPWVDVAVHHEGEEAFTRILKDRLQGVALPREIEGGRVAELEDIPSPYLVGVFDELMEDPRYREAQWDATSETHRGCPYFCVFCDWGSAVMTKVRAFSDERVKAEYEWMGQHRIGLAYNGDANYGLLPRDEALARSLVETKAKYGYPKEFRAAYAKNSNERVFQIAKTLNDADMCKGVTLSFQSLDPRTLQTVKRKNMAMNDFRGLIGRYRDAGIPTYTELILGLPGETYDSFANGINTLLENGQHDSLNIYPCMVLPNAEMADPEYRREHGIQTVVIPDLLTHSVPSNDPYPEKKEIVVATKAMPLEDWKRAYLFGMFVQAFHSMGLTQYIARYAHLLGVSYREFYEALLEKAPGPFRFAKDKGEGALERVLNGGPWDEVVLGAGPICWTPEEAVFLWAVQIKADLYAQLEFLVKRLSKVDVEDTWALFWGLGLSAYEYRIGATPDSVKVSMPTSFAWPLHEVFRVSASASSVEEARAMIAVLGLKEMPGDGCEFEHYGEYNGDLERYAREIVWYGRKACRWRAKVRRIEGGGDR